MKSRIIILITIFLWIPLALSAQSNDGVLAGSFLRMGIGARAMGMGGAYTAIANGPEAAHYNPGAMPFLKGHQIMASYRFLSLDRKFSYLGYAQQLRPKIDPESDERPLRGGLALSWIYAGVDNIDGRNLSGEHIGDFSNSESAFSLSFGLSPIDIIGVGITGKVLYNRFPKMKEDDSAISEMTVGIDFGILMKPLPFLALGFVIKDINAKYDWKTDKVWEKDIDKIDHFPRTYRGGIAVSWPYQWATLGIDVEKNDQEDTKYFLGLQVEPISSIIGRLGVNQGNISFGAGYQFKIFNRDSQLHYALVTRDYDVSSEHIFTWLYSF